MANSDCHLIELYHNLFLPDYDNGLLYWKPNPHKTLAWNNKFAEQKVNFCTSKTSRPTAKPYYVLWANGKNHRVNRVIYIMGNEKIPDMVDHENHDTLDNRLVNLYDVSNKENSRNRGLLTHNKTGYNGISFTQNGKYRARISVEKKDINLGTFDTLDEAIAARCDADIKYGFHKNHGK